MAQKRTFGKVEHPLIFSARQGIRFLEPRCVLSDERVPFYPDCMTTFLTDTDVVGRPIRIFGGTQDDYNPIAACKAYVERLRTAGADVEVTEYPNASHAFDNPLGARPAMLQPRFQSARNCKIREEAD